MQRSLYPDGILVDTTVLAFTELSKASEILRARTNWTSRGIYSGGAITVGAVDNTRIDIAGFTGFVPNGEYVALVGNLASIQLDSAVLNDVNYVVAFYTESETLTQPHETLGVTYATRAVGSYRVRVYEESLFLALPMTDANLANDARDRALLLGKVTGNGVGVVLTSSNITSPTVYNNILYSDPMIPLTIPGVTISGVSPGMSTGAGTLDYTWAAGPIYGLQWTSFGGGAGAVVNPTIDGDYAVLDGAGEFLTISVVISQLSTATPISETLTIHNLYEQAIPRQTAIDNLHRNMTGTGTPTPTNAHGLSLDDLSGSDFGLLAEHRDTQHSVAGINHISSPAIFSGSITFPVGGDLFSIVAPALGDLYYINGQKLNTLTPTSFQFIPTVVPSSASGVHMYEVGVSDSEDSYVTLKMSFPAPRTASGCFIVDASDEYPAGVANLALTVTNPAGTDIYSFSWDAGETVTVYATDAPHMIRLFAVDAIRWIDVWVNTTGGSANADFNPPPAVGVYSDAITIFASADITQNMPLASFPGAWDVTAAPPRFQIGYPTFGVTRNFVDKRRWGTLAKENIADETLRELIYNPLDELHYSGILYSRNALHGNFELFNIAALSISVRGGAYYCRGERIEFEGNSRLLIDNTVNLLYLDLNNTLQVLDVTADFTGMSEALEYLIGRGQLMPLVNDSQYPERGCPLYEFTTVAGAITRTRNIARNVNGGQLNPWSVGNFALLPQPVAAFDSLYSAFLYAGLRSSGIEIELTGASFLTEHVVQPSGVDVRGHLAYSQLVIQAVDLTGAWEMSIGNRIKDVYMSTASDASAAIEPKSDCTISGCEYHASGANSGIFVISSLAVDNVRVEGCEINTRSGAVVLNNSANTNIFVRDNVITGTANNSALGYGLITVLGTGLHVTGNHVVSDNSTDLTACIQVQSGSFSLYVEDNILRLGDGSAAAAAEYGLKVMDDVSTARITGNDIQRTTGETSQVGIGIYVVGGVNVYIGDNTVSYTGVGIQVANYEPVGLATHSLVNFQVRDNNITGSYHRGIDIDMDALAASYTVSGMQVENNRIFFLTKGASGLLLFGNEVYGIRFLADLSGGIKTSVLEGLSFCDNNVNYVRNTVDSAYGVYLACSAGATDTTALVGLRVDGNQVNSFQGADTFDTVGVYTDFRFQDNSLDNSICNNIVATESVATTPGSLVVGIYSSISGGCKVSSNFVNMYGATDTIIADGIHLLGPSSIAGDNHVQANWIGLSNFEDDALISDNIINSNGVGILNPTSADRVSISDNHVTVVALNAVTTGVAPTATAGGIYAGGGELSVEGNKVVLYGETVAGPAYSVPDEGAHIFVTSSSCAINSNQTSLGNDIDEVASLAPDPTTRRAYHIYYQPTAIVSNAVINDNKIENYVAGGSAMCGIYLEVVFGGSTFVYCAVSGNHIRGSNLSVVPNIPCNANEFPYEFGSHFAQNVGLNIYCVAQNNVVMAENAGVANYPAIYWADATTQEPFTSGTPSGFATNFSPGVGFW